MMVAAPVVAIITATAAIGVYMGTQHLRGVRPRPMLSGIHFLLGAAGLEVMGVLLNGAPNGDVLRPSRLALWAGGLIAAALLSGLFAVIIAQTAQKRSGRALVAHAGVASAAFLSLWAWALFN